MILFLDFNHSHNGFNKEKGTTFIGPQPRSLVADGCLLLYLMLFAFLLNHSRLLRPSLLSKQMYCKIYWWGLVLVF